MKIAFVFDSLGFGGVERLGIDYVNMLVKNGYNIDVYNLDPKNNDMKNQLPTNVGYFEKGFPPKLCPDLYAYGVKKWWWGKYAFPLINAPLKLLLWVRKIFRSRKKYDVAIAFAGHISDLTYVAYNFLHANKKLCWSHGGLAEQLLVNPNTNFLYRKINNLVVLSDLFQDAAIYGNKFLSGLKIKKIYNPTIIHDRKIDSQIVDNLKHKYGDFVLSVGRFTKRGTHKDQWTTIDAVKILKEKYEVKNKFIFVGDGESRAEIEKYAAEKGVAELCVFEGSRADVQNYYAAAKIFVHSTIAEGFGLVYLEAMTFGLPIVTTEGLPGTYEVFPSGKYGIVVPVGDGKGMADGVNLLLTNKEAYEKYASSSAERLKAFSPEVIKSSIIEFIENLQ